MSKIMTPQEWEDNSGNGNLLTHNEIESRKRYAEYYHGEKAKELFTKDDMMKCYRDGANNVGKTLAGDKPFPTDEEYVNAFKGENKNEAI